MGFFYIVFFTLAFTASVFLSVVAVLFFGVTHAPACVSLLSVALKVRRPAKILMSFVGNPKRETVPCFLAGTQTRERCIIYVLVRRTKGIPC